MDRGVEDNDNDEDVAEDKPMDSQSMIAGASRRCGGGCFLFIAQLLYRIQLIFNKIYYCLYSVSSTIATLFAKTILPLPDIVSPRHPPGQYPTSIPRLLWDSI